MSIPPLVCNTPPPPDQCEDDRDTEDFDIHYNLSQDDEDDVNDYNYGTYSNFMYPTSTSTNKQDKWSPENNEKADNNLPNDLIKEPTESNSALPEDYNSTAVKIGFEDIVIEDLNLTLEDQNDLSHKDEVSSANKCDIEPPDTDSSNKEKETLTNVSTQVNKIEETDIGTEDFAETNYVDSSDKIFDEDIIPYAEDTINQDIIEAPFKTDDMCCDIKESTEVKSEFESAVVQPESSCLENKIDEKNADVLESQSKHNDDIPLESKEDNFEDFDDFQFISSDNNPAPTIEYCDNPWDSEISKDCEFGNFTANFDAIETNQHTGIDNFDVNSTQNKNKEISNDITDDFGDFNDFKSSENDQIENTVIKQTIQNEPTQSVPVLNMYTPESEVQIIESINSVLNSIFISEISENESMFEGNLETLLNETWGHLVDTDVRQPYIVHWNNSLGQKSLLKALCIDSRNILFGPKWQNGMPKYAVNLTVAPLQPQKPFVSTNTVNDDQNIEKNTNKETSSWTDPFTSDGQESCNTEGGSTAAARPTNLDVFTNVAQPEGDKIYSSTLSVQPIRQISLPDTHIFTPTDSETPRSKTIHYDQGSAVLVPQPLEDTSKINENVLKPKTGGVVSTLGPDDDYWEFQDFKGSESDKNTSPENRNPEKSSETAINNSTVPIAANYQPQILQPIKVEPVMPALNWPAPGEVKETFDDFSDFVSSTPWTDSTSTTKQTDSQLNSNYKEESISKMNTSDDDFETFQSAPTSKSSVCPADNTYQTTSKVNHNFNEFPHFMNSNEVSRVQHSKTNSLNMLKPTENIVPIKNTQNSPKTKSNHVKTSPVLSTGIESMNTVLQPTISNTSSLQPTQKKTGQILQPLTLESFSQINWPNPGIDLQDLSRFNPLESVQSLKTDIGTGGSSKTASPAHKDINAKRNDTPDDDIWGDFVSSKPKQQQSQMKKSPAFADDDEWTDFVSSPSVKPQNGLNTISFNVHTNSNMQKTAAQGKYPSKGNPISLDIPTLNYVTPKSSNRGLYNDKHFQNL